MLLSSRSDSLPCSTFATRLNRRVGSFPFALVRSVCSVVVVACRCYYTFIPNMIAAYDDEDAYSLVVNISPVL